MRKAADTIKQLDIPIDGIVGFPTATAAPWELTSDGIESHFERNYLCYFVLVNLLLEKMSVGSRVVMVTTSVRQDADAPMWRDVNFSVSPFISAYLDTYTFSFFILQNGDTYHPLDGYAQSMFANIVFAKALAHRSIAAFSANPGSKYDQ